MIPNPIVSGFHPDAPVILISDQNVVATSTFEWFDNSMRSRPAATYPIAESAP